MVKKETRAKSSLKKRTEFTEEDITRICELGREKYTVAEISSMLELNKKGVSEVLSDNNI